MFQLLERSHSPHAVRFVPENCADNGAEHGDEEVLSHEPILHQKQQESHVEYGGEKGVEKVSWEEQFAQFHVVAEHADFHFANQHIVSADVLFLNQAQFA